MCCGSRHGRMRQGHQMSLSAKAMVENQGENNLSQTWPPKLELGDKLGLVWAMWLYVVRRLWLIGSLVGHVHMQACKHLGSQVGKQ